MERVHGSLAMKDPSKNQPHNTYILIGAVFLLRTKVHLLIVKETDVSVRTVSPVFSNISPATRIIRLRAIKSTAA